MSNVAAETSLVAFVSTLWSISRDCSTTPGAVPSATGGPVYGSAVHAMVLPSGDQRGCVSLPKLLLIFSAVADSTSTM